MSERVGVLVDLPEYVVAVAGLPRSAERVGRSAGAIVVVDGSAEWWDAAAGAVEAGAAAVLVAEPRAVPLEEVVILADRAAGRGVPIVVHRSSLRADLVDLAVAQRNGLAPRVTVAECRATADALPTMVRDAIGWTRSLAGARLVLGAADRGRDAGTALLRADDDGRVVGSMLVGVTSAEGAVLRLQALGEASTEVEIDVPLGHVELATSTAAGRLVAPAKLESGERASVRRAIDTVARGMRCLEVEELLADARAAESILGASRHPTLL
ncbi:hypothetical protein J2X63_003482 [Agromyces sp. 3263]|uniref:hypothetical protein n=1 Tax=Agromyces sp. 3263 TaxID=2817750 RepID=UPI00285920E3|nr:hypothetical protein [Agromyces sp. 3263]MDR6907774.1 hypothetical protein [Agromyces sp. 3263]